MWERFSFYTMFAIFVLYMDEGLQLPSSQVHETYAFYSGFVYFTPLLGGWLADKLGGARVTLWNFVLMIAMVFGVLHFLPQNGEGGNFYGFLGMFMLLFITTGVGNGSTFRMIPVIFRTQHEKASAGKSAAEREQALKDAGKESAAVLGFSSAMGAFGAFFIPHAEKNTRN
jgi:nitrate/nitrite transporter NarK